VPEGCKKAWLGYLDFKAVKLPPLPSIVKRPLMLVPVSLTVPAYVTSFIFQLTLCPFNSPVSWAEPPEQVPVNCSPSCLKAQSKPPAERLLSSKLASTSQFPVRSSVAVRTTAVSPVNSARHSFFTAGLLHFYGFSDSMALRRANGFHSGKRRLRRRCRSAGRLI